MFAEDILNDIPPFDNFNFEAFRNVFEIIGEIIHKEILPHIEHEKSEKLVPSEPSGSVDNNQTLELPRAFKSIDSFMNLGAHRKLFQHDLLFFTDQECHEIEKICDKLIFEHFGLLLGNPASGKTITACKVASKFQKERFQVYYHSFKYQTPSNLWDDIYPLLHQKILFVIDDCHFDMEYAGNIYRLAYDIETTACFLFISRNLSEDVRRISKFEFNLFDELQEQTFTTKSKKKDWTKKIAGIISNYQRYFQRIHKKVYETGQIEGILTHVNFDLLALSFYLDFWENSNSKLSDIDKNGVLKAVYGKYWKDLSRDERHCLLHYVSLYHFEIEFEPFHELGSEEATQRLAEKGIIVKKEGGKKKECYAFYHSSFSALLLDAYIFENASIFRRKYQDSYDNFLFEYIRDYVLAFKEYGYPVNLSQITHGLFIHQSTKNIHGNKIAQKLCK